ncbi:MAG: SDR family oxidoreductase [Thermoplasmataceae archaeon]
MDPAYFHSALTNNAATFYNAVEASLPLFSESGGSIVVVSAARNVYLNSNIGYAAGKGAVDYMVKILAKEFISKKIRVNAISPGFITKENCGESASQDYVGRKGRHGAISVSEAIGMFMDNNIATGQILEVDAGFSSVLPDGY